MPTLYLVRGIPGSGKSTLARKLVTVDYVCEADDFFTSYDTGTYRFEPEKLKDAHEYCQRCCEVLMKKDRGIHNVAVANTFTRRWEMEPYIRMAREYEYTVQEIICKGRFANIHDVPESIIQKMIMRFEY